MRREGDSAQSRVNLRLLLRPLIRFCLSRSLTIKELYVIAKEVFVEEAEHEIRKISPKINVSRLSVLTGLHRRDVHQIYREKKPLALEGASYMARVLAAWEQESRFLGPGGKPRTLSYGEDGSEFHELVTGVSKNISPGTVLFELLRIGAVQKTAQGLKFVRGDASARKEESRAYEIVSRDIESLITAVGENVEPELDPNLHIRTEYDNIYVRDLERAKAWVLEQGKAFHRKVRAHLARIDADVAPRKGGASRQAGGRIVVTSFSLTGTASNASANVPEDAEI